MNSRICKSCGEPFTTYLPHPNLCLDCIGSISSDYAGEQHAPHGPTATPSGPDSAYSAVKKSDSIPTGGLSILVSLPELLSLIHRIAAFQTHTFPHQTLQGKLNHLVKEAQEVADCAGNDPHEWADVLNLLLGAALLKGWTLADLVRFAHDKMAICEQRQWPTEPGPDGCYHHVKEAQ